MLATIFTGVTGAISVWLLTAFETNGEFQFISQQTWIKSLGIEWFAGIDGISLFLVVLTGYCSHSSLLQKTPKTRSQGLLHLDSTLADRMYGSIRILGSLHVLCLLRNCAHPHVLPYR
ncbi:MAG: hypothetical protein Ct9H90mP30_1310 [Actinomycetota bacterium]|nr:MAG: hypothetical protein Ct9H90mP30_1310 [Actinomycetota bacterium]